MITFFIVCKVVRLAFPQRSICIDEIFLLLIDEYWSLLFQNSDKRDRESKRRGFNPQRRERI
jgi:hypothetical protein